MMLKIESLIVCRQYSQKLWSLLLEGLEDRHDILLGDTLGFGHVHDLILLGLLDADIGGEIVDLLECGGIVRSEGDGAGEGTKSCDGEEFHFKVFVVGSYLDYNHFRSLP